MDGYPLNLKGQPGKAMGASRIEVLKYANSGDTAGGKGQVVGYLAAAIVK